MKNSNSSSQEDQEEKNKKLSFVPRKGFIGKEKNQRGKTPIYELYPEVIKNIIKLIESGSTFKDAAILSGISENTLYDWLKRSLEFKEAVYKARAAHKKYCETRVYAAMKTNWQAAAWWLERKYFEEFASRTKIETTIENSFRAFTKEVIEIIKEYVTDVRQQKEIIRRLQEKLL